MSAPRIAKVCSLCGSENIAADAAARWNVGTQQWEVLNVFDDGHCCDDCGSECRIVDRPDAQALGDERKPVGELIAGADAARNQCVVRAFYSSYHAAWRYVIFGNKAAVIAKSAPVYEGDLEAIYAGNQHGAQAIAACRGGAPA